LPGWRRQSHRSESGSSKALHTSMAIYVGEANPV